MVELGATPLAAPALTRAPPPAPVPVPLQLPLVKKV
jgi:hypothetical protein